MNNLNFNKGLNLLRIFPVLLFSLFSSSLYAQEDNGTQKEAEPPLVTIQGATIYSADASFNQQLLSDKVVVKEGEAKIVMAGRGGKKVLIVKASVEKEVSPKDMLAQLKKAKAEKEQKILDAVKKEIAHFENEKKEFQFEDYDFLPVSEQFLAVGHSVADYVLPSTHSHDFSNAEQTPSQDLKKKSLDYLHSKKYISYNSRSLDFCFSEVFSVRPPPVLI